MDTISRENNSLLPMGGVIIGAVALIIGGYAAISLHKVNRTLAAQADKVAKIDDIASQVASASAGERQGRAGHYDSPELHAGRREPARNRARDARREGQAHRGVPRCQGRARAPKGEPAVAGPGEYIVKPGDTGAKIARANGVSLSDLTSVNPGVSWTHLKVGEKLKLPEKK